MKKQKYYEIDTGKAGSGNINLATGNLIQRMFLTCQSG